MQDHGKAERFGKMMLSEGDEDGGSHDKEGFEDVDLDKLSND